MGVGLTTVDYRKEDLKTRLQKSENLRSGAEEIKLVHTGEEGVNQMRAILGLHDFVTNVNLPNIGHIPNLPMGAVVETNAVFSADSVRPVMAGEIPQEIYPLVSRICGEQELVSKAIANRDLEGIFNAFVSDPLVTCTYDEAKELFREMVQNTKKYLTSYNIDES